MNNLVRKSLVKKYYDLYVAGNITGDALRTMIEQDPKVANPEDAAGIFEEVFTAKATPAIKSPKAAKTPAPAPKAGKPVGTGLPKPAAGTTLNKIYEEWEVEPQYEQVTDAMGKVLGRKIIDFVQVRKFRETSITPERANTLNQQAEVSFRMYYLRADQDPETND